MAVEIIDGIGSGYFAQVDNTNRLMVRTEGITLSSSGLTITTGSESWIKGGSIQTYSPLGVGSVLITNQYLGSESWEKNLYTGSKLYQGEVFGVSGNINTGLYAGSDNWLNYKPKILTGSVVVTEAERIGSKVLPTLQNQINWISVKYLNQGSAYAFGINDSEGYLIQSLLPHTGNYAYLSAIQASGLLVFTISGTQASGTYNYRIAYN